MRISDWSSDVCSSDLKTALRIGRIIGGLSVLFESRTCDSDRTHAGFYAGARQGATGRIHGRRGFHAPVMGQKYGPFSTITAREPGSARPRSSPSRPAAVSCTQSPGGSRVSAAPELHPDAAPPVLRHRPEIGRAHV